MLEGGNLTAEWTLSSARTHNRRLLKSIDRLLGEAGWELESLDAFAAAAGPGSFTGLRIGMTTMKMLAWSLGKPYASVCTLDALALPFFFSAVPICALIDARRNEVYCALYRPDEKGGFSLEMDYAALSPLQLAQNLASKAAEPVIFCGDGWISYGDVLKTSLGELAVEPPPVFHTIRASSVGALAGKRFARGESDDASSSAPFYLRPSEAEINYPYLAEKSSDKPQII